MSVRGLIVLVVLLAVALGALVWMARPAGAPVEAPSDTPLLRAFADDAVRSIDVDCGGSTVTLTRTAPSGWRLAEPAGTEADPRRVNELLAALHDARARKAIADDTASLSAFGLAPPACVVRVALGTETAPYVLRLGRGSPVGTGRYAAADDGRVVLTDGSLYGVVARGADALRERRLIPVDPEAVVKIVLDRPDGRVALARVSDAWKIEAPYADVASTTACAALSRAIVSIEVIGSDAQRPPDDVMRSRRLRVEVATSGRSAPFVASVAAAGIDGKRLGWRQDGGLAGLVAESEARELERSSESFRETRIASFSVPDVRALQIEQGGAPLRVARAEESSPWSGSDASGAFPVDSARVTDLLEKLRGLTCDGFASGAARSNATGTIVVSGEGRELARVTWGPLESETGSHASQLWITTPDRPGAVFRIEARRFEPIPARAADLASPAGGNHGPVVGS